MGGRPARPWWSSSQRRRDSEKRSSREKLKKRSSRKKLEGLLLGLFMFIYLNRHKWVDLIILIVQLRLA